MDKHARVGSRIVSFWPGFLVEADAITLPGSENHFAWQIVDKLSAVDAKFYHIMTFGQLSSQIQSRQLDFLVLDHWTVRRGFIETLLQENDYHIGLKLYGIDVWQQAD